MVLKRIKKAISNLKDEPYFHVEMDTEEAIGIAVKADWNTAFIRKLDQLGYDEFSTEEDKVNAYIMNCYYATVKSEGGGHISELHHKELDEGEFE